MHSNHRPTVGLEKRTGSVCANARALFIGDVHKLNRSRLQLGGGFVPQYCAGVVQDTRHDNQD